MVERDERRKRTVVDVDGTASGKFEVVVDVGARLLEAAIELGCD